MVKQTSMVMMVLLNDYLWLQLIYENCMKGFILLQMIEIQKIILNFFVYEGYFHLNK
jgi:hypothetical protein